MAKVKTPDYIKAIKKAVKELRDREKTFRQHAENRPYDWRYNTDIADQAKICAEIVERLIR